MTDGAVYLPLNIGRAGSFFLPQRPFIAVGTLRDQILYPDRAASQDCGDEELVGILKQLQLAYLLSMEGGLDAVQRWDDILSPGEQQRLQFARLLYHKPMFAFMDEVCTVLPCVCVRAHHCVAQPVALWLWRGVCRCLDDNRGNHTTEHQRASGSARGTVHAASTTGGAPLGFGCALRWRTERGVCVAVWLCGCMCVWLWLCGCGCVWLWLCVPPTGGSDLHQRGAPTHARAIPHTCADVGRERRVWQPLCRPRVSVQSHAQVPRTS